MKKLVAAGLFLFVPALFGQLSTNSVTVTASNTVTLQPDQIVYSIEVGSPLNATLDQVVAAVASLGITAANLSSISGLMPVIVPGQSPPPVSWFFSLAAPIGSNQTTVAQLATLQQTIAKQKNGLAMSFSVKGTQISQQLQQSQPCVLSDLLAQARTQAQSLASAAGFNLDVIQGMSTTISTAVSGQGQSLSSFLLGAGSAPCSVTVKFGLNHNQ
jgi:Protein of unknown function (DUF541)